MSFPVVLAGAIGVALALIALAALAPGHVAPVIGGALLLGLAGGMAALARQRVEALRTAARGPTTYTAHSATRMKSVIEAFNADARVDVPRLVGYVLQQAVLHQASDVHLVPYRDFLQVRYRVDGILTDIAQIAPHLREPVTNRLKVLSKAVSFVHDRPQDGRIDLALGDREVDLRAAFMPTLHGERIVMRVLDRQELGPGLAGLGFSDEQLALFQDLIFRPQGMVILNGPAGSGKTTTIYGALRAILEQSQKGSSIYTLEDPIEYDLLHINQTQIEESQGFTFAEGLRNMLRQDPDVIMVGEIRDLDTARIAVQAGMTGHLIISTVHAKQAAGVFVRLSEIGVDPHSVAASVTAVVAQRLLRVLCEECKRPGPATPGQAAKLGRGLAGRTFHLATGCAACGQKGYSGRKGVFEVLAAGETIRDLVSQRSSSDRIHRAAVEQGMTTLLENALRMAGEGRTSLDEVLRVLPPEQRVA